MKRGLIGADLAARFAFLNQMIESEPLALSVSRDPDDDAVLACAQAGRADFVVSGDQDLLVLQQWRSIRHALTGLLNRPTMAVSEVAIF